MHDNDNLDDLFRSRLAKKEMKVTNPQISFNQLGSSGNSWNILFKVAKLVKSYKVITVVVSSVLLGSVIYFATRQSSDDKNTITSNDSLPQKETIIPLADTASTNFNDTLQTQVPIKNDAIESKAEPLPMGNNISEKPKRNPSASYESDSIVIKAEDTVNEIQIAPEVTIKDSIPARPKKDSSDQKLIHDTKREAKDNVHSLEVDVDDVQKDKEKQTEEADKEKRKIKKLR